MADFFRDYYLYLSIAPLILLGVLLFFLVKKLRFLSKLNKIERGEIYSGDLSKAELIRYYKQVERHLSNPDSPLYGRKEIGDLWVEKLIETGGVKWYNLILKHFPGDYLYPCFIQSLRKKKLFKVFQENLGEDEILTLEILGKSGESRDFDGQAASELLDRHKKTVSKLISSPLGDVRFFAYNILVHYNDRSSIESVLKGFSDSYKAVRICLVKKTRFNDREQGYRILEHLLLHDPSFSVRKEAAHRINKDFSDLKSIDPQHLTGDQAVHYISLMDLGSEKDERNALFFMESQDLSIVREAALFLEKRGVFDRYSLELHLGDKEDFERKISLMKRALSVNVSGFFENYKWEGDDRLLAAARLLKGRGDLKAMENLVSAVFARDPYDSEYSLEIYKAAALSVDGSASDECHKLKAMELKKHQDDPLTMEILLSSIPGEREFYYMNDLFYLLEMGQPFCQQLVRERLSRYDAAHILTELHDQLLDEEKPVSFRADVLIILTQFHLDYTLQMILEHLPLLSDDQLISLSLSWEKFDRDKLHYLAGVLFDSCDGDIHRSLIYSLPLWEALAYEDKILKFGGSRDWDIRKAAITKLHGMGRFTVELGLPFLNDPDFRVRAAAVSLLMDFDEEDVREVMGELLFSEEEPESVRDAVIMGLIKSDNEGSLDLLFDFFARRESHRSRILEMLSCRADSFFAGQLVRNYVKLDSSLREMIKPLFINLGMNIESSLSELLKTQSTEARKLIEEILDEGGYLDRLNEELKSPLPSKRVSAVEKLISLEKPLALKTAIMAVGDPEKAVRIAVIRALERLNSSGSALLIQELTDDPDKKVRTFALWAKERLESRNRD
ncbi:MAG: HEAT repeat domain-containing protein [Spirochaetales bacterium]|nr:HEAT repeat domain-containing protein [Spirochaetales bacterium]